jgi:purine-binding chemotaxis protein CheW
MVMDWSRDAVRANMAAPSMRSNGTPAPGGADVVAELRRLEAELARAHAAMASCPRGTRLPGSYLLLEAGGSRALAPAAQVEEVVRVVATTPLPGAPDEVLGTFVHRGRTTVAIDLAAALGVGRVGGIDAHLIVFGMSRPVAILVDRVAGIVEGPEVEGPPEGGDEGRLFAALGRARDEVLPILRPDAFVALAARASP